MTDTPIAESQAPTVEVPPSTVTSDSLEWPKTPPVSKRYSGLKRYPKGTTPPGLRPGKRGPTRRTLEAIITRALNSGSQARLEDLAEAIIQGAIAREPACLSFLLPRLWPLDQGAQGGRVVLSGIRLEVAEGKASVTMLNGQSEGEGSLSVEDSASEGSERFALPSAKESQIGSTPLDVSHSESPTAPTTDSSLEE